MKIPITHCPLLIILFSLSTACNKPYKNRPSFEAIKGIRFTEIRRAFNTGYSFSESGFQQKPEWILNFMGNDSAKIYSPWEHKFIEYPMYYSHDSVYNFARQWLRIRKLGRDSIVLQLLQVKNKEVIQDLSIVYMTFYSDSLLKAHKLDPEKLKLPNRADTLYVRLKAARANRNPTDIDSAFAARNPVMLISKNPNIQVHKLKVKPDILEGTQESDDYLYPEYRITVKGAYANFVYPFRVLVDDKGNMHYAFNEGVTADPEGREKTLKVIMKGYLEPYLDLRPGSTLGIKHTSAIKVIVKGVK